MLSFPILRYLTPEPEPPPLEGFTRVDQAINTGLPHVIRLDAALSMLIVLPTGEAALWRDSDPTAIVSSSDDAYAPTDSTKPPLARPPLRLLIRRNGRPVAGIPLVANVLRVIDVPDGIRRMAVVVLQWDIRVGSLRGAGDFGSRITLAWRWADESVHQYSTPPLSPSVEIKQPPQNRLESSRFSDMALQNIYIKALYTPLYRSRSRGYIALRKRL